MLPTSLPPLDAQDYQRFRALVRERCGLDYPPERRAEFAYRLRDALVASQHTSLDDYYRVLLPPDPNPEMERLITILTVGETYFFRNRPQFDALTRSILPELIAARTNRGRSLRFWSAACATGEEPYSLAITLRELIPDLDNWHITILATDIDRQALREAQAGVYRGRAFRKIDPLLQKRYFRPHGDGDRRWILDDTVRRMVTFAHLNLTGSNYPSPATQTTAMDLILCRNVTIYFPTDVIRQVAERLYRALIPGGWLVVGASELNMEIYHRFGARNFPSAVIYQRPRSLSPMHAAPPEPPTPKIESAETPPDPPTPLEAAPLPEPPSPPDYYEQALALRRAGDPSAGSEPALSGEKGQALQAAQIALQKHIEQHPAFAPAYVLLAKILADQGRLAEAQDWGARALKHDKVLPDAHFTLAQIHQELDQPDAAEAALKTTLFLDRDHVAAHLLLSTLYQRRGQTRRARKALENAANILRRLSPDSVVPDSDEATAGELLEIVEARLRET